MGYCSEGDRTMKHPRLGVKRPRKGWCMLVYLVGRSMELFEHRVSANIDGHSVNHHFPTRDVLYFLRYHCITNFQTCPPWVFFGALPRQHLPAAEWIKAPIWRQGLAAAWLGSSRWDRQSFPPLFGKTRIGTDRDEPPRWDLTNSRQGSNAYRCLFVWKPLWNITSCCFQILLL